MFCNARNRNYDAQIWHLWPINTASATSIWHKALHKRHGSAVTHFISVTYNCTLFFAKFSQMPCRFRISQSEKTLLKITKKPKQKFAWKYVKHENQYATTLFPVKICMIPHDFLSLQCFPCRSRASGGAREAIYWKGVYLTLCAWHFETSQTSILSKTKQR